MQKSAKVSLIVGGIILALVCLLIGYLLGKNQFRTIFRPSFGQLGGMTSTSLTSSFASQASFNGKVTQIKDQMATVLTMDNQTRDFTISKSVAVLDPAAKKVASVSANSKLTTIPLNQPALITVQLVFSRQGNNTTSEYQITNVLLAPPTH